MKQVPEFVNHNSPGVKLTIKTTIKYNRFKIIVSWLNIIQAEYSSQFKGLFNSLPEFKRSKGFLAARKLAFKELNSKIQAVINQGLLIQGKK